MVDTERSTASPESPQALFTADEGVETLWVTAYQGEVLGEALFGRIADRLDDAERAAKMRVLATLERKTKEAIAPSLERAGISTDPDAAQIAAADAMAEATSAITWEQLLGSFEPITKQFTVLYERIGELDPSEQAASDLLVAHEAALCEFARRELAGDTATSLDRINALAHMH